MSHRSRAQSPVRNNVVQDGNGSWSGCALLPACNRFLPFRHLLPWLSSTLTNAAIWPGGLWNGKDARGDELTNLCKKWPRAIPVLAWA